MICRGPDPDCSNTPLDGDWLHQAKELHSCQGRGNGNSGPTVFCFQRMCTPRTAQHAIRFPSLSLTPPSLHVSQGHKKHFSCIARTCGGLHDVHTGAILLCPLPKGNAHKVLGACMACTEVCETEMSWQLLRWAFSNQLA